PSWRTRASPIGGESGPKSGKRPIRWAKMRSVMSCISMLYAFRCNRISRAHARSQWERPRNRATGTSERREFLIDIDITCSDGLVPRGALVAARHVALEAGGLARLFMVGIRASRLE